MDQAIDDDKETKLSVAEQDSSVDCYFYNRGLNVSHGVCSKLKSLLSFPGLSETVHARVSTFNLKSFLTSEDLHYASAFQ